MKYLFSFVLLHITLFIFGQHQDKVDFTQAYASIEPNPHEKQIRGSVTYEFKVHAALDSIFLDAKDMYFSVFQLNGKDIDYVYKDGVVSVYHDFKAGSSYALKLAYLASPKQTVYFLGWDDEIEGNEQIWTQGQGKYTSHWLPSFDDMEEKVEFDLDIPFDEKYQVISNGKLVKTTRKSNTQKVWSFNMQNPMSSYLLAFAIGDYSKQELTSKTGIAIENYFYPQDSLKVEPTYRYTRQIFDFLEREIGVAYPWQIYKQLPVRDFLYAGMENTAATIFADGYVIDSTAFIDKNYVNVNAHELAHQWFGDLVTEKSGNHHWLHEGFATYYAYLAEKEIFGDDHFYWKYYKSLLQLQNAVDRGEGQSLVNAKASSLTFYEKGAWALFMLRELVGDAVFKKGIRTYLEKYKFKNVTVPDFLEVMEKVSDSDLSNFKREWLESSTLPFEVAKKSLAVKSESLTLLFTMKKDLKKAKNDDIDYLKYWQRTKSAYFKQYLLDNYFGTLPETLIKGAFASNNITVRQSLAIKTDSIPLSFKQEYESLLDDKSYITQESALFKLWASFPKNRKTYLEKMKDVEGLPNKNIRLLWLTLAILTNDYDGQNTQKYYTELTSYTAQEYTWETRMGAFQYISEIGFNDFSIKNLINATAHHSWQFRKFARDVLDDLLEDPDYKIRIEALAKELKEDELRYLNTKL